MEIYPLGMMIGQYEIVSKPMKGGMGAVYCCLDHKNKGRPVALKTLRSKLLPDLAARERFLREGAAWMELGYHPHIVRCYEVKYIDPVAFLVLELISKERNMPDASLRSWLIPGRPLPINQSLFFVLQIARGMQYASEKIPGFVHRDLKPENILVGTDRLPNTNVNRLRVTDFGLSTILKDETEKISDRVKAENVMRTQLTQGIVGTPLYMAPEQWQETTVGIHTDIYALGCILYEMISGQHAAMGKNVNELQVAHCMGNLSPLSADLPHDVCNILTRSTSRLPTERYQNWDEFVCAIEAAYGSHGYYPILENIIEKSESLSEYSQVGESYNKIGLDYLGMGKIKEAVDYFKKALTLAQEVGDRHVESSALSNLGLAYAQLGDASLAIEYHEKSLTLSRAIGDRYGEANALGNLGVAYGELLGDVHQAIDYLEQTLTISREINDQRMEGYALGNLGLAFYVLGNPHQSIKYQEQSLFIARETRDRRGEGNALGSLGEIFRTLGDLQKAINFYEQQLVIVREIGDQLGEAEGLGNLGIAYKTLGDTSRSIECYEQSLLINRKMGNLMGVASVMGNIAILYMEQGESDTALEYAQESLHIFTKIGRVSSIQRAKRLVNQLQEDATSETPAQSAFKAFQRTKSLHDMQVAIRQYPMLKDKQFVLDITDIMNQHTPPEYRSKFQQQLDWLKYLTKKDVVTWDGFDQSSGLPEEIPVHQVTPIQTIQSAQSAMESFLQADSFQAMQVAVKKYPEIKDEAFILTVEVFSKISAFPEQKISLNERLGWLKQIINQKQPSLFGRIFGKKR